LAGEHQSEADYHGDLGTHDGDMAAHDYSADVASGGSYESHDASADYLSADHSGYDASE
jgi:hypothetical protein